MIYIIIISFILIHIKQCFCDDSNSIQIQRACMYDTIPRKYNLSHYIRSFHTSKTLVYKIKPFRIHFSFDKTTFAIYDSKLSTVLESISYVKEYVKKIIDVKFSSKKPLKIPRRCFNDEIAEDGSCRIDCSRLEICNGVRLPKKILDSCFVNGRLKRYGGDGIENTDLIIYLANNNSCSKESDAYSSHCGKLDPVTLRPLFGVITFCNINRLSHYPMPLRDILLHQLFHIMGFSRDLFAFFINDAGKRITNKSVAVNMFPSLNIHMFSSSIAKSIEYRIKVPKNEFVIKKMWGLVTPKALLKAQQHFQCRNLKIVPLEDFNTGFVGFGSHLDELYFGNELMTVVSDGGYGILSEISLAFLEDTGWYLPKYLPEHQIYNYAKNTQCDFILNGCYEFINRNIPYTEPFCFEPKTMSCSTNYLYTTVCDLQLHNKIGKERNLYINTTQSWMYFYYSENQYAERCPTYRIMEYENSKSDCLSTYNERLREFELFDVDNQFGQNSTCFPYLKNHDQQIIEHDFYFGSACFYSKCLDKLFPPKIQLNSDLECHNERSAFRIGSNISFQCPENIVNIRCKYSANMLNKNMDTFNKSTQKTIKLLMFLDIIFVSILQFIYI